MTYFTEVKKKILKLVWIHKNPQVVTAIINEKNIAGRLPYQISSYITELGK